MAMIAVHIFMLIACEPTANNLGEHDDAKKSRLGASESKIICVSTPIGTERRILIQKVTTSNSSRCVAYEILPLPQLCNGALAQLVDDIRRLPRTPDRLSLYEYAVGEHQSSLAINLPKQLVDFRRTTFDEEMFYATPTLKTFTFALYKNFAGSKGIPEGELLVVMQNRPLPTFLKTDDVREQFVSDHSMRLSAKFDTKQTGVGRDSTYECRDEDAIDALDKSPLRKLVQHINDLAGRCTKPRSQTE